MDTLQQGYDELMDSIRKHTYKELLEGLDEDTPRFSGEFIEATKFDLIQVIITDEVCKIFWECMRLYNAYGFNYFQMYLRVAGGEFGDFSKGLEHWRSHYHSSGYWECQKDYGTNQLLAELTSLIESLRFFGCDDYQGLCIADLEKMLQQIPSVCQAAYTDLVRKRADKGEQTKKAKVESYYNFDRFEENKFNSYVERCTAKCKSGKDFSIDDALRIAQDAPQQMYVVILKRQGKACYIGKTQKLLEYIGMRHKKVGADGVSFEVVDADYVDDVLLATMIFYDFPLDHTIITKANRKYTTIKQACFAYMQSESLPRKAILHAIQTGNLRVIEFKHDQEIVDKLALEKALRA